MGGGGGRGCCVGASVGSGDWVMIKGMSIDQFEIVDAS